MDINHLINTMNDDRLSLAVRTKAAARLWETQNRMNKTLKAFKNELIALSVKEGTDLEIRSTEGKYMTTVQIQPPTPKVDTLDPHLLREELGDELFNKYIAHSYTIKWSEFRNAEASHQAAFYNLTGLEMAQTYQVKFQRSSTNYIKK